MATQTLDDVDVTDAWEDLTVTHASLVSAAATIQNVQNTPIAVVFGGGTTPTDKSGIVLGPREWVTGAAANVWARAIGDKGAVSVTLQ